MTKHEYICAICDVVRSKSDCYKRKVGAVFVNEDYEILATGYNGAPRGFAGCDRQKLLSGLPVHNYEHTCGEPCSRNIHAELNGLIQAAKRGTALKGSILFCTYTPCVDCARALVNVCVSRVWVMEPNEDGGYEVLRQAGIPVADWIGQ